MFYQKLNLAIETWDDEKILEVIQGYFNEMERQHTLLDGFYSVMAAEIWAVFQYSLYQSGNSMIKDLNEAVSITDFDRISSREMLEAWILPKIKMYCNQKKPSMNPKHKQAVDFMMEYIHQHYVEDITLEDLANQLYISKNYLNQLFKKVTGETFMNYVIRVRMQEAKALLIEGKLMVYEVSEKVGYQNVPYFSTLFKKYWGVNPSDYSKHSGQSDEM